MTAKVVFRAQGQFGLLFDGMDGWNARKLRLLRRAVEIDARRGG